MQGSHTLTRQRTAGRILWTSIDVQRSLERKMRSVFIFEGSINLCALTVGWVKKICWPDIWRRWLYFMHLSLAFLGGWGAGELECHTLGKTVGTSLLFNWAELFISRLMLTQDWKLTEVLSFLVSKCFSLLMVCVVWDYSNSKLNYKQYKQKTSPISYKIELKILANLGLA